MTSASLRRPAEDGSFSSETLTELVEALRRGELVVLPTETVYGLAARADSAEALDRMSAAKNRPANQAFTWHVASPDALERFPDLWAPARRLAERYWPGPLTLVLHGVPGGLEQLAREGWTGVRCPSHPACEAVLSAADFPVAMSSLNEHGQAPAVDVERAARALGDASGVALTVDGGPSRLGEASTVLAIGPGRFEVLRPGLIDEEALRQAAGLRLAFVCTGNTCRSPMAEALARRLLAQRLGVGDDEIHRFGFEVSSFGAFAMPGAQASEHSVSTMAAEGIDLSGHRSMPADARTLGGLDRIYGLTSGHLAALEGQVPEDARLELLDPDGRDVPDPIGQGADAYRRTAEAIREALRARLSEWV